MNEILKLLETRELYIHIILFKIYLETKGNTNRFYGGNLQKEVSDLIGPEFSNESYVNAEQYLESIGYLRESISSCLTINGRQYFEEWIKEFNNLNDVDKDLLNKKLSNKVIKFFQLTEDTAKTLNSLINLAQTLTSID